MPDSAAPSTPHAVDVELDSDQRLMVVLLLRPAVIRGSWTGYSSDRVDAVEVVLDVRPSRGARRGAGRRGAKHRPCPTRPRHPLRTRSPWSWTCDSFDVERNIGCARLGMPKLGWGGDRRVIHGARGSNLLQDYTQPDPHYTTRRTQMRPPVIRSPSRS